ncbi:hypothetical protein XELAEV_18041508mg [Xenopus laevis]|uniref:Uncharacterized protein n=1 Tax=Xenopus laevis TaxID=8355 RepID=A0A974H550_XENLA|nr:hypothetical protein XELAEV_18041508mg [Xenopus laevis]
MLYSTGQFNTDSIQQEGGVLGLTLPNSAIQNKYTTHESVRISAWITHSIIIQCIQHSKGHCFMFSCQGLQSSTVIVLN